MTSTCCDIAIIGMACVLPKAGSVCTYWQNIVSKKDGVSDPPADWQPENVTSTNSANNDQIYCQRGGYLGDIATFDPAESGTMPQSLYGREPERVLAIRVARDALSDAGYLGRRMEQGQVDVILGRGSNINRSLTAIIQHGVIIDQTIGVLKQLHADYTQKELQAIKRELQTSLPSLESDIGLDWITSTLINHICDHLGLTGSHYMVDAGSASSLIAVELGIQGLLTKRCNLALVGGMHVPVSPPMLTAFSQLKVLSKTGLIRPFDKDADGMLLGEGLGMVVLKRQKDAERDGDRIYALIKGIGTASDNRVMDIMMPRAEGQELALRRAYETTGISPHSVELIEAHGDGMPLGDMKEIEALHRVFGQCDGEHPWCALGSVKSMIGNLMPAAGIAGLIKVALALHHKILPPTLHYEKPNPKLEIEKTPFYVNTETRPWFHSKPEPRRAGVSAFGFEGFNAHAILEEYAGHGETNFSSHLHLWDSEVFIIQAESRQDLIRSGDRLLKFLSSGPKLEPKDLAFTLNCPLQKSKGYRLAIVASSLDELEKKLSFTLKRLLDIHRTQIKDRSGIFFFEEPLAQEGTLAFLFPGEGSQYINMLRDLCIHFPEVRAFFDRIDRVFIEDKRDCVPSQVLFPFTPKEAAANHQSDQKLFEMHFAVASVFAADYALFKLLDCLQIRAQAMAGHSSGEFTALLASGAMESKDDDELFLQGLDLIGIYGSVENQIPAASLLTVGATDPTVIPSLVEETRGDLYLAMDNCPHQVIFCGSEKTIASLRDRLKNQGTICNLLPYNRPYHTPLFRPIYNQFSQFFKRRRIMHPHTTLYSCATAQPYPDDPEDIRRLAAEQWIRPVRFRETIEAQYAAGVRLFVEVGPKGNLTAFVNDILGNRRHLAVPTNIPHRSGISQLHHLIGLLVAHGVPMRLDPLYARRAAKRVSFEGSDQSRKWNEEEKHVKLAMELPRLQLSKGGRADTLNISSSCGREPLSRPRQETTANTPAPVVRSSGGSRKLKDISAPAVEASSPALNKRAQGNGFHRHISSRSQVMTEYLKTMEQFLDSQQEVLAAFQMKERPETLDVKRDFDGILNNAWPRPVELFPPSLNFQCCRVIQADEDNWPERVASEILCPKEQKTLSNINGPEKRTKEWLLGRFAAKYAIRLFLRKRYGKEVRPTDIEITADEYGRPELVGISNIVLLGPLSISIAHSGKEAVAVAGERDHFRGVGIDIEGVNQGPQGLEKIALSEKEQNLLSTIPGSERDEWLVRLWCAKEAVAKAIGRGMVGGPLNLVVKDVELNGGRVAIVLSGELARQLPAYTEHSFYAFTGSEHSMVFASSLV